ncbi:MAG: aspartate aminotransferase family protein [Oscillospiraceae bacterium]|nr:aspartate aminotransferase family protein [Oscillospiraceae bacterium]
MHLITSNDVLKKDCQYISHTYNRFSVALKEGHGAQAIDFDGKKYIDFGSGIGTNSLGFCNEKWLKAIVSQAEKLQHTSNLFYTLPDVLLAERLCEITDYFKIFFGNSGAEANEGAIKIARKYGMETKEISCNRIITLKNSFHGRTITTLAATGQDVFHQYFDPFTDGFRYVPANDSQAFDNALDETICAVMIELVQGEGGVTALSKEYVAYIAEVCKERDILLIVDEVQTGVGRTGTFLCCERYGIHPNIITLAKGLGAGLPIGAVLMDEKTENVFQAGHHGSTFGGNPVVCAGALEVLDQIADEDFLAEVCMKSEYIREKIAAFPHVKELSGIGLMLGITLSEGVCAADIAKRCAEQGLLILTAKNKLRMLPPLNITKDEIDTGIGILRNVLSEI